MSFSPYSRRWQDRAINFLAATCFCVVMCGVLLAGYGLGVLLGGILT